MLNPNPEPNPTPPPPPPPPVVVMTSSIAHTRPSLQDSDLDSSSTSEMAVDGRTANNNAICSHSSGAGMHWWAVDLGQVYFLSYIRIYNGLG